MKKDTQKELKTRPKIRGPLSSSKLRSCSGSKFNNLELKLREKYLKIWKSRGPALSQEFHLDSDCQTETKKKRRAGSRGGGQKEFTLVGEGKPEPARTTRETPRVELEGSGARHKGLPPSSLDDEPCTQTVPRDCTCTVAATVAISNQSSSCKIKLVTTTPPLSKKRNTQTTSLRSSELSNRL